MDQIEEQVDNLFNSEKDTQKDLTPLEAMDDEIKFKNKIIEHPIKKETYSDKIMGKSMNFQSFLAMIIAREGVFEGDNYVQMIANWRYDWVKRLLKRTRRMPFNWTWLIIILGLGVIAILVIFIIMGLMGGMG